MRRPETRLRGGPETPLRRTQDFPRGRRRARVLPLLLACAALFGAASASAQASAASEVIWSATMTTAHVTGGNTGFGITLTNKWEGDLTNNEFTLDGVTYRIRLLARNWGNGDLLFEVQDLPESCCPVIPGEEWTLHVDNDSFAIKDAAAQFGGILSWPGAPNWSAGQKVDVKLVSTEDLPFPELLVQGGEVEESGDPNVTTEIPFTVSATPEPAFPVGVHYETEDVTATGGTTCSGSSPPDYISTEGRLTFGSDEVTTRLTSQKVIVTVCDDSEEDSGETFRLVLRSTQLHESIEEIEARGTIREYGADEETGSGTGTITNDETSAAAVWSADMKVVEYGTGSIVHHHAVERLGRRAGHEDGHRHDPQPRGRRRDHADAEHHRREGQGGGRGVDHVHNQARSPAAAAPAASGSVNVDSTRPRAAA